MNTEIKNEKKFKPIVYVIAPMNDEETCLDKHRAYCHYVYDSGCIPLDPNLLFPEAKEDDKNYLKGSKFFLSQCDQVWVFDDADTTVTRSVIDTARHKGMNVQRISGHLQAV